MRISILLTASLASLLMAWQAAAQEPASDGPLAEEPATSAPEVEDVLTWDELPAELRRRAEPMIGRVAAQAVPP